MQVVLQVTGRIKSRGIRAGRFTQPTSPDGIYHAVEFSTGGITTTRCGLSLVAEPIADKTWETVGSRCRDCREVA